MRATDVGRGTALLYNLAWGRPEASEEWERRERLRGSNICGMLPQGKSIQTPLGKQ